MEKPMIAVTLSHATQLLFIFVLIIIASTSTWLFADAATQRQLLVGFQATPDPSVSSFQPLLNDPTGNFSLGFLRLNRTKLSLTVVHVPSMETLWQANPGSSFPWSHRTQLAFNGSLIISDPHSGIFWSTGTHGDKVVLNSPNLQIQKLDSTVIILWQSFDFPTNTLVLNQNFTANMSLVSSNGLYSLRLGDQFMALYAKFEGDTEQIYWKHRAMQAKADIVEGRPIYARVNPDGFLGMYQIGLGDTPVDVQAFNSFQRPINGFLFVRLEPDGNLKGYNWDGANLVLNYQAIDDICELPSPCGSYGLCRPGYGCSCLDNRTKFSPSGECFSVASGDFCGEEGPRTGDEYWVLRREGVELPFKELMSYKTASSLSQCESFCENNCSCWGAVYNNASGFCYIVDYPIRTLLGVVDTGKAGYFKVRKESEEKKMEVGIRVGVGFLCGAILVLFGAIGFGGYKIWKRRRGVKRMFEEDSGLSPGPYKDLGSASFRSIEMCNT